MQFTSMIGNWLNKQRIRYLASPSERAAAYAERSAKWADRAATAAQQAHKKEHRRRNSLSIPGAMALAAPGFIAAAMMSQPGDSTSSQFHQTSKPAPQVQKLSKDEHLAMTGRVSSIPAIRKKPPQPISAPADLAKPEIRAESRTRVMGSSMPIMKSKFRSSMPSFKAS